MKRLFLLSSAWLAATCCQGGVSLVAGDSVYASFGRAELMPRPTTGWVIKHGTDKLYSQDSYRLSLFEDSLDDFPLYQRTFMGMEGGLNGLAILGFDSHGFFSDFQGFVRIDMLTGSVDIVAVSLTMRMPDGDYGARMTVFQPIPEPGAAAALLAAIALLAALLARRPHRA